MNPREPFLKAGCFWIWSDDFASSEPERSPSHYEVRRFRRTFDLAAGTDARLTLHVSADSRYALHVNGTFVGRGPAKGDLFHQFYDSYDVSHLLRPGRNVIAALVMDFSRHPSHPPRLGAPASVMTFSGGFVAAGTLCDAAGKLLEKLGTNDRWRVQVDQAFRFHNDGHFHGGFQGYFEDFRVAAEPTGWREPDFDDGGWAPAYALYAATPHGERRDTCSPYGLLPRMIAPMEEAAPAPFTNGFLPGGGVLSPAQLQFVRGEAPLVVAPHTRLELILDAGQLVTGFPTLQMEGGAGGRVELAYAEALRIPWGTPGARILGRPRDMTNIAAGGVDEHAGWTLDPRGTLHGWYDRVEPAGGAYCYEPFHWRTFQFAALRIQTGAEPLTLHALRYRFTAYPFQQRADFSCSHEDYNRYAAISYRTFRLCSHETYVDCPCYEQMQYSGDSMITAQIAMFAAGDPSLTRQALHHFDWSRLPEGITQSRFPSRLFNVIPTWGLHWVTMARDYLLHTADADTLHAILPGLRAVMGWFEDRLKDDLPQQLPYWNNADWCPDWVRGEPPGWAEGPTLTISSLYLATVRQLAWIEQALGHEPEAQRLEAQATRTCERINEVFWNEHEGLYFDRPGGPELSQYGIACAVYAGAADEVRAERLLQRFPDDPALAPASFFGLYHVLRALRTLGAYDRAPQILAQWQEMADFGLSTWAEETTYWRSLCHAWTAHPLLEFLTEVLGVQPLEPGFRRVSIAPQPIGLDSARGHLPTPLGDIEVAWRQDAAGFDLVITAPTGMEVEVVAPGGETHEFHGGRFEHRFTVAAERTLARSGAAALEP